MTEQEWDRLLDAHPDDTDLRGAYATWLQDDVDDVLRADFQRWLIAEKKWPTNAPLDREENGWAWYWQDEPTEPRKHATLHKWALDHMPRERWLYPSRRQAEEVLFHAWRQWQEIGAASAAHG